MKLYSNFVCAYNKGDVCVCVCVLVYDNSKVSHDVCYRCMQYLTF